MYTYNSNFFISLKMKKYIYSSQKAFTLVELIVTISILAILGTIAFVSFLQYHSSARDTIRLSDTRLIERSLEVHYLEHQSYPDPSDFVEITFRGQPIWKQ